jgi:hypothetical protein
MHIHAYAYEHIFQAFSAGMGSTFRILADLRSLIFHDSQIHASPCDILLACQREKLHGGMRITEREQGLD